MNFSTLYKVFDTVVSVLDAKKEETRKDEARERTPSSAYPPPTPSFADQVEARLTNVVVAALKEAFDRDHARLELERAHLEEQRRRAEETMRLELQREAIDREIGRLRLLASAGLVGWIASVVLLVTRGQAGSVSSAVLIAACTLLLGSVGFAFSAQANAGTSMRDSDAEPKSTAGTASLWLLLAGLALAAGSLLF